MAIGQDSNPARFLGGQTGSTNRELALKIYGGEVLTAFDLAVHFADKVETKSISSGKSIQFPKTWKASSEYHSPGVELLGQDIDTTEIIVTVDDILVAHTAVSDLDEMLAHFDVRGPYAQAMGHELAKVQDKNIARSIILSARTSADGPFPAGTVITDSNLTDTGVTNGDEWVAHIREANRAMFALDVPEYLPRFFAANANVFDAIKYAEMTTGNFIMSMDRRFTPQASIATREDSLQIDGVTVFKSRNLPTADEATDTDVYSKYRGDYSTTTGMLWTPMAVANAKLLGIAFENIRDTRRLEDFLSARMLVGHGTLRPECAVEFKTS